VAEIPPTGRYDEQHHRGSALNGTVSVGADGTGRYPDSEWARHCVNLGGTAEADESSRPLLSREEGFFIFIQRVFKIPLNRGTQTKTAASCVNV